jgi:hypothetical protein
MTIDVSAVPKLHAPDPDPAGAEGGSRLTEIQRDRNDGIALESDRKSQVLLRMFGALSKIGLRKRGKWNLLGRLIEMRPRYS